MSSFPKASRRTSTLIAVFSVLVCGIAVWAMTFSAHRGIWLVCLVAAIPIFAAIAGNLPDLSKLDRN